MDQVVGPALPQMEPYHEQCLAQVRTIHETFFWNKNISPALTELHTLCLHIRGLLRAIGKRMHGLKSLQEREEFALAFSKLADGLSATLSEFECSLQLWLSPPSAHLEVDFCIDLQVMLRFQSFVLENLGEATST
jgi:hypothetical protein